MLIDKEKYGKNIRDIREDSGIRTCDLIDRMSKIMGHPCNNFSLYRIERGEVSPSLEFYLAWNKAMTGNAVGLLIIKESMSEESWERLTDA